MNNKKTIRWCLGVLLCTCVASCSSDSVINDVDEPQSQVPMQFSQAAVSTPVTRSGSSKALNSDFLVSCYKGIGSNPQVVMDLYQVKFSEDQWSNLSKWEYVGTKNQNFYKDQIQRYWDSAAFPYQFYGVAPFPAAAADFKLTDSEFSMPTSVEYTYQTYHEGMLSAGAEPYSVAQVLCEDLSNINDKDVLNGSATIQKSGSSLSRYVAMPFHHLTSKVRFLLYNNYKKELPATLYLNNLQIKVTSDNFVMAGRGYTATLANTDMLHGKFKEVTTASTDADKTLIQTNASQKCDMKKAIDLEHAYDCECPNGLLQIPQNVKLTISFEIHGVEYREDFTNTTVGNGGSITYDKASKTVSYINVPLLLGDGDDNSLITWAPNTINTYVIKINEFYPLSIDFTAELIPWSDVEGSIDTNLEK